MSAHHVYLGPEGVVGRFGPGRIRPADSVVVHLLTADEARRVSDRPAGRQVPLTAAGLGHVLSHPEDAVLLHAAALDFRAWLDLWTFRAEGSPPQLLGPNLWPSQERYADAAIENPWCFYGKARQLGCTELASAFAGYRLRFGPVASRVHLFSVRDDEARELLEQVRFGFDSQPPFMRLPVERETQTRVVYSASRDDKRVLASYPASRTTSRSSTATHALVDEWDQMPDPERVMASVEPTVAPGGSFHVLTTIVAPESPAAAYWRRCEDGEGAHVPVFVGALERPDRTPEWLEQKRRSMPPSRFLREYPQTAEEMLAAGGDRFFEDEDLDAATEYARGLRPYEPGRRYLLAVDVGRQRDASVLLVLDVTPDDAIVDVVRGERLVGVPFPQQQALVERIANEYRAHVVVEDNNQGIALRENLSLPEHRVHGYNTTGRSKPVALEKLYAALRQQLVKWDPSLEFLTQEMRGYTLPDTNVRQDAVMALSIGVASADNPSITRRGGRVGQVITL